MLILTVIQDRKFTVIEVGDAYAYGLGISTHVHAIDAGKAFVLAAQYRQMFPREFNTVDVAEASTTKN